MEEDNEQNEEDKYPGASSNKRVKLRAEQLHNEGAAQRKELLENKQLRKLYREQQLLEGARKRPTI
eukprot:2408562-Heterocapsa_arctica.AAC.1